MIHMNTAHHATRTYRNRPACAGSGQNTTGQACEVCGRTDLSWGVGTPRANHLHANDLAGGSRTVAPATDVTATHNARVAAEATNTDAFDTAENVALLVAFATTPNADTYAAVNAALTFEQRRDLAARHNVDLSNV